MHPVTILILILTIYTIPGVAFAIAFVARGAGRIDPVARSAPIRVRLLFAPGAMALWPLMLRKWVRAAREGAP